MKASEFGVGYTPAYRWLPVGRERKLVVSWRDATYASASNGTIVTAIKVKVLKGSVVDIQVRIDGSGGEILIFPGDVRLLGSISCPMSL